MSHLTKTALIITAIMAPLALTSCGGDTAATTTSTTTITSTVTTLPPASAASLREGLDFNVCPDRISAIGSLVTSCEFAYEVRQAYLNTGSDKVYVKSPVTKEYYTMYCTEGYIAKFNDGIDREAVVCDERDDAVVVVFR